MQNNQNKPATPQDYSPLRFDAGFTASVIEHMNNDHAEACLLIVREMSAQSDATSVAMTDLDTLGMVFSVTTAADGCSQTPTHIRIDYPKQLRRSSQVRGMLVAMSKQVRDRAAG